MDQCKMCGVLFEADVRGCGESCPRCVGRSFAKVVKQEPSGVMVKRYCKKCGLGFTVAAVPQGGDVGKPAAEAEIEEWIDDFGKPHGGRHGAAAQGVRVPPQPTSGQDSAWLEQISKQLKQTNALLASISTAVDWLLFSVIALLILQIVSCLPRIAE